MSARSIRTKAYLAAHGCPSTNTYIYQPEFWDPFYYGAVATPSADQLARIDRWLNPATKEARGQVA